MPAARPFAIAMGRTYRPNEETDNGDFRNWVHAARVQIPIYDPTVVQALGVFPSGQTPLPDTGARLGTVDEVTSSYLISPGTQVRPAKKLSVKGDLVFSEKPGPNGPKDLQPS